MAAESPAKLSLKAFDGKGSPIDARIFIRKLESYAAICKLTDEQTADCVKFNVTDVASRWFATLEENLDDRVLLWSTLRPAFETRFCRAYTPAELASLCKSLEQKSSESVDDFMDRCQEVQFLEEQGVPVAIRQHADTKQAFQDIHNNGVSLKFINGLQPAIRKRVTADSTADSLEHYLRSARRAESSEQGLRVSAAQVLDIAHRDGRVEGGSGAAATSSTGAGQDSQAGGRGQDQSGGVHTDANASVDALRGRGKQGFPSKIGGHGSSVSSGNGNFPPRKGRTADGVIICYGCGQPGHIKRDCRNNSSSGNSGGRGGAGGGGSQLGRGFDPRPASGGSRGPQSKFMYEVVGQQIVDGLLSRQLQQMGVNTNALQRQPAQTSAIQPQGFGSGGQGQAGSAEAEGFEVVPFGFKGF